MHASKKKNLKILHINTNFICTNLHRKMIESLGKFNTNNDIYVPAEKNYNSVVELEKNVCVSECFNKNDRYLYHWKQRKIIKDINKKYCINEYDCIHAYTLFTDGNVAYYLNKLYGIPYIVTVRNTDLNLFFKYMFYLRKRGIDILKNASFIVFLSKTYKDSLYKKYVPKKLKEQLEKKTYIIANGVDSFWLNNTFLKEKKIREKINIIYAGRIDKNKNIETTIKAIDILKKEGYIINYTLVGKICDKTIYNRIKQYDNINYHNNVRKEKLIELYRKNDIFVMPSHTETFGLVYAEAMSQGLPIIYTKGQGFDGQFKEGTVGYHVNDKKPEEIADAIVKIIMNYSELQKNCIEGCKKFDWNEIVKKYYKLYDFTIYKGEESEKKRNFKG